jgi:hypothetical protein
MARAICESDTGAVVGGVELPLSTTELTHVVACRHTVGGNRTASVSLRRRASTCEAQVLGTSRLPEDGYRISVPGDAVTTAFL